MGDLLPATRASGTKGGGMSWDPDEFSGPLNFDAAAAMEILDSDVTDRLIALLESDEPIDGSVRSELAKALQRGKREHCEAGAFSVKIIGLKRARQASYYGQKEYFDTMYADGLKIQKQIECGKATSIAQAIKQIWNGVGRNPASRFRDAHEHCLKVNNWIESLEKPPFWIKETESWRSDKALIDHFNGMSALQKLHDKTS